MWTNFSSALKDAQEAALKAAEKAQTFASDLKQQAVQNGEATPSTSASREGGEKASNSTSKESVPQDRKTTTKESLQTLFTKGKEVANDIKLNARATAEEVEGQFWNFTSRTATMAKDTLNGKTSAPIESDTETYGATEAFIEFVRTITPSDFLSKAEEWPKADKQDWSLTPWQEKHVVHILSKVKELRECRFKLTPKKMTEQKFWEIYFALSQKHLFTKKEKTEKPKEDNAPPTKAEQVAEDTATKEVEADDDDDEDDDNEEDLEAYLESVLADKVSDDDNSDVDDVKSLDAFINELEEDISDIGDIVEVNKDQDLDASVKE